MGRALPTVNNTVFNLIGEGLYLATLKDVGEPRTTVSPKFGEQTQVRLIWHIEGVLDGEDDNEEYIGEEIWDYCGWTMGKKAKLRQRIQAALGRDLEEGEELNTDDILGKRVKLNIEHYSKEDGTKGQKVASAMAYRTKKKRRPVDPTDEDIDELPF